MAHVLEAHEKAGNENGKWKQSSCHSFPIPHWI